jgi:hypothetical protein
MDRAERVAGELMRHTPDSYDSRGERQTAISAILRREFQAVEREAFEEAAGMLDEWPFKIVELNATRKMAAALRARAKEEGAALPLPDCRMAVSIEPELDDLNRVVSIRDAWVVDCGWVSKCRARAKEEA